MAYFFQLSAVMVALVALVVGPVIWQLETDIGPLDKLQALAEAALREIDRPGKDVRFSLQGDEATVVTKEEEVRWSGRRVTILAYRCTYCIRNPSGEYFVFVYRYGSKPYVKHIPHVSTCDGPSHRRSVEQRARE